MAAYKRDPDAILGLSAEQFRLTQEDGTERPFKNEYWNNKPPGLYVDIVSGEPLFASVDKFDSGTGWPSFTKPVEADNVVENFDTNLGMRYCINSAALRFIHRDKLKGEGYGVYLPLFNLVTQE